MHIVLDVLVAAIVVFTVIGAVRKGFVRSLLSLVGLVLSLVLTYSFAVPFGAVIDSEVVTPMAAKSILKQSELDGIPGVGPKRKAELLRRFGSLKAIRAAGLTELENLLPAPTAAEVYRHFHETKEEPPCESSPEVPEA